MAALAVVVLVAVLALRPSDDASPVGRAPTFTTFDLGGRRVALTDYRGRVVLLNFWASWCIPCRSEFPLLRDVHGGDVTVLGVVFDDSRAAARRFMRERGATWPGLIDPRGQIARAYGVGRKPGIPVTVAVGPAGALAGRHIGEARRADLDRLVEQARRPAARPRSTAS